MKTPSVTELCDILNKPALMIWANKIGLEGIKLSSYKKESTKSGIKKHKVIEDYLIHGLEIEDVEIRSNVEGLFNNVEVLSVEESFENEMYRGRCDIRFKKDGYEYVCDFKSKFNKPYLEHYIQLIAYKQHFNTDKIAIIDLRTFTLFELSLQYENEISEIINNLISIHKLKQIIK